MPWSKSAKSQPAQSMNDLGSHSAPQSNSISGSFKKTTASITEALTIKPKVIPATDATSLNSSPEKIGADLYIRAARIHESRGNFAAAEEEYGKALKAEPKSLNALVSLARLHDRQQNFTEAERLYTKAGEIDASSALVWNDLGLCYARQHKLEPAVTTLHKAIGLQPQNQKYRNNMATVLVEMGRTDDAWAQLTAANPPAVAHYNMAFLLNKQGQRQLAIQHLELALAADASLADAEKLLVELQGSPRDYGHSYVSAPQTATSYSISDQGAYSSPAKMEDTHVASAEGNQIVNPLSPSTRRSATYRMPPTSEHASDPAPRLERLPDVPATNDAFPTTPPPAAEPTVELGNPAAYPARKISHEVEVSEIQQPKNTIRLLGGEPLAAPIPTDD
jgi:tetratricopeptide (TPR) repeat protein